MFGWRRRVDLTKQWTAARRAVAIADLSARRARLRVAGKHRTRFLHNLTSNDIAGLAVGTRCRATLLNPQGKLLADFHVYNRGDDLLVECVAEAGEKLYGLFDRYIIADDVELRLLQAAELPAWAALGPQAAAFVRDVLGATAPDGLAELVGELPETRVLGGGATGAAGAFGEAGPAGAAGAADAAAAAGGAGAGERAPLVAGSRSVLGATGLLVLGTPPPLALAAARSVMVLDDTTLEVLRLEGGVPRFGAEVDERLLPQEAALDAALSFTKGCYVGQEAVAMLHYRGKLRRKMLGLVVEPGPAGEEGAAPVAGARVLVRGGDEDVGRVTSAVRLSPAFGRAVALALLKLPAHEPGTMVDVELGDPSTPVRVAAAVQALPLVA